MSLDKKVQNNESPSDISKTYLIDRINEVLTSSHLGKKSLSSSYDIAQLSSQAYAVRDKSDGEVDVYFNIRGYNFTIPDMKKRIYSNALHFIVEPSLPTFTLGCLEGAMRHGNVKDFKTALKYAEEQLKPKTKEDEWYKKPNRLCTIKLEGKLK